MSQFSVSIRSSHDELPNAYATLREDVSIQFICSTTMNGKISREMWNRVSVGITQDSIWLDVKDYGHENWMLSNFFQYVKFPYSTELQNLPGMRAREAELLQPWRGTNLKIPIKIPINCIHSVGKITHVWKQTNGFSIPSYLSDQTRINRFGSMNNRYLKFDTVSPSCNGIITRKSIYDNSLMYILLWSTSNLVRYPSES